MSEENKINFADNKTDILKIVIETRNFEISNFWKRSNYFLVLNSALAVGFFRSISSGSGAPDYQILFSIIGIITSYLWLQVTFGGKFWQEYWEYRLKQIERTMGLDINLFDTTNEVTRQAVQDSFAENKSDTTMQKTLCNEFDGWLEKQILNKPSVTKSMTKLSLLFVIFWIVLLLITFL